MGGRGASGRGGKGGGNVANQEAQAKRIAERASAKIEKALTQWENEGKITGNPIRVGYVDREIRRHAKQNGNALANSSMYFTGKGLSHAERASKVRDGLAVSKKDFSRFPIDKSKMKIYYDTSTKNYTYTDGKNKFVLKTNEVIKIRRGKKTTAVLVTASKLRSADEFNMKKYVKLRG